MSVGTNSGFKKFDQGKLKWNLLPIEATEEIIKVLEFGAKKYGDFNWLENSEGVEWTRYMNAADRHFAKFKKGVDIDEDSGLLELAHLATNILMLLQYQVLQTGKDNRDYRIGQKMHNLTVLELVKIRHKTDRIYKMQCTCGVVKEISYNNVLRGNTTSCGCVANEVRGKASITHGKSKSMIYNRYRTMINRCYDPKTIQYHNYGGRGIIVSEDWLAGFENFYRDMGDPPTKNHQLDRIDNNGPYSKENCRWVTSKENLNNTTRSRKYQLEGKSYSAEELSEKYNINKKCLIKRIRMGWDLYKALTTPSKTSKNKRNEKKDE